MIQGQRHSRPEARLASYPPPEAALPDFGNEPTPQDVEKICQQENPFGTLLEPLETCLKHY